MQIRQPLYSGRSNQRRGFTLLELLAVVATIATLAALLLPVLSKSQARAHQAHCMSNLRQLGVAWVLYKDDNNGMLAQSYPVDNPDVWVQGDMTNPAEAVDTSLISKGKLFPYNANVGIYRCPTDPGVVVGGSTVQNVRSYSMNSFMGARDPAAVLGPPNLSKFVPFFARESDLSPNRRGPSGLFVFLDEDERSIDNGSFVTDPNAKVWFDLPTISRSRHNASCIFIMADGHSEIWKFRDPLTASVNKRVVEQGDPNNRNTDLQRLAEAATVPLN